MIIMGFYVVYIFMPLHFIMCSPVRSVLNSMDRIASVQVSSMQTLPYPYGSAVCVYGTGIASFVHHASEIVQARHKIHLHTVLYDHYLSSCDYCGADQLCNCRRES